MPDIVVMFFILGLLAGLVKSDLEIPKEAYEILSLLLMLTIGLKGGMALHGNLGWFLVPELLSVALIGVMIPLFVYPILRHLVQLNIADSASFAAHYGSVSAGTFAVALAYAETNGLITGGQVTLYLVLLELPAIVIGIFLFRKLSKETNQEGQHNLLHEAFTNRGVLLLVGGVVIGWMYGPQNGAAVTDLYISMFKGILALFLLEMGLVASEALSKVRFDKIRVILFAFVMPSILAWFGLLVGYFLNLPTGSVLVLAALTASASYIAAPVAIRGAVPSADIGLVMLASLGVTFPFNVIIGIPLYHSWIL
jgi:hypothetical protein